MFKVNYKDSIILKLSIVFIFLLALASCANSNGLGALADSMLVKEPLPEKQKPKPKPQKPKPQIVASAPAANVKSAAKQTNINTTSSTDLIKNNPNSATTTAPRRGFFAWLFGSSSKKQQQNAVDKKSMAQVSSSANVAKKTNTPALVAAQEKKEAEKKPTVSKEKENKTELTIVESSPKLVAINDKPSFSFLKWSWNKILEITRTNSIGEASIPYKENSISVENNLNIVVLRIPNSDDLNKKEDKAGIKLKKTKLVVEKSIPKDELYSGFDINIFNDSKFDNLQKQQVDNKVANSKSAIKSETNTSNNKEELYKDYIIALKYEGVVSNYTNTVSASALTQDHKDLLNQLLTKSATQPKVLYVVYRNTDSLNDNSSAHNQLHLTNYLNVIRAYVYSKNRRDIFVQEVQSKNLPINQVLLVLKPITTEQFKNLPKQLNIYNAPKMSSKTWIDKVNLIDQEKEQKQEKLHKQAQGK